MWQMHQGGHLASASCRYTPLGRMISEVLFCMCFAFTMSIEDVECKDHHDGLSSLRGD